MALTEEEKDEMRSATYDAAVALLDDLEYMEKTFAQRRPTSGDVRRLSGIMRRLLLDGHLQAVAAPRIGKIKLQTPDFEHWVRDVTDDFFTLGLAPIFEWSRNFGFFEFFRVKDMGAVFDGNMNMRLANDSPPPLRELNVQAFLSDRIVRAKGTLVSRGELLQFICYHDFGVHYSGREEPAFALIRRFRNMLTFFDGPNGALGVIVADHFDGKPDRKILMNLAHALTFSTAYYLVKSADVVRLRGLIESEIASAHGAT